jgi:DNA mismatch repair protein MutS
MIPTVDETPEQLDTPAMRQYRQFKQQYPDYLLLFRMGDFYEMFYEDAKTASRVLGLTLTSRSKGPTAVPLAGIPYHALDSYLSRLIKAGLRVAICEQVEDPALAKGLVKRDVTRLVTPGTLTDETLLDQREGNYLAAVFPLRSGESKGEERRAKGAHTGLEDSKERGAKSETAKSETAKSEAISLQSSIVNSALRSAAQSTSRQSSIGIAWVELSSGAFWTMTGPAEHLMDELIRIRPAEVIFPEGCGLDNPAWRQTLRQATGAAATSYGPWAFDAHAATGVLNEHFQTRTLAGFGFDGYNASISAAGAVIQYLRETQKTALAHIRTLKPFDRRDHMAIDGNTLRCLEVHRTLRTGNRAGSLLACIDQTCTGMGARLLERWLSFPLTTYSAIVARQDAIEELAFDRARLTGLRELLQACSQIDRIAANIALSRVRPRELVALGATLKLLPNLQTLLAACLAELLSSVAPGLAGLQDAASLIERAIDPDCPNVIRDGGVIAKGYEVELDRLRRIGSDGQSWLAQYQADQVRRTGVANLKVGYNHVFGYYIEITNAHADKAPPDYIRKQTLKNAERYITDDLKRYESEVLTATERARKFEATLYEQLRQELCRFIEPLQNAAAAVAMLDVLAGLASLAVERGYKRPTLTQDNVLHIVGGKHPVLAAQLREQFVPNDVHMDAADNRLLIITGPNMAGKSTYIRQAALLVLLAQTGSFIPAEEATIGLADRIFTRVGAADELTAGLSTFMLEMVETANILNNATSRSLVILDEVGRGTSTYDGLALAWAISEHIALRIKCRTLFATHYHELTELEELLDGTSNLNVAVREWADQVIFLHKIVEGGADRSYGVHVARMAGVPKEVIARARALLPQLQAHLAKGLGLPELANRARAVAAQMDLFANPAQRIARDLKAANLDEMTPMQAMDLLRKMKAEL